MNPAPLSLFDRLIGWLNRHTESIESSLGLLRLIIFFVLPLLLVEWIAAHQFETVDAQALAEHIWAVNPFFRRVPPWAFYLVDRHNSRYLLAPLYGFICILFAGGAYIQDLYGLKLFRTGIRYILSSAFGFRYPRLIIDGGKKQITKGTTNLIDVVGGPGYALVQPGNAVTFQFLRSPSGISNFNRYFLKPFETVHEIISLDEQHESVPPTTTFTRDGLQVRLTDVHFRFRLLPRENNTQPQQHTPENAYAMSEKAVISAAYNRSVDGNGQDSWHAAVRRVVIGSIIDFINANDIDYLTAPRAEGVSPRLDVQKILQGSGIRNALRNLGAELLWVDVGHLEIIEEEVDEDRLSQWAAPLRGDAATTLAYGEAKLQAYHELGRAEAQAELILSITQALENVNLGDDPGENLRTILLTRTAQVLDSMRASQENRNP